MFCSSCGENIPEYARFCKHCGAAVQPDSETVMSQEKSLAKTPTLGSREQVLDTRVAWLVIAGGVIVAAASFMPWISATTILGSVQRSAWQLGSGLSDDGTGPIVLIVGLLIASVGWAMLGGRARRFSGKRIGIAIEIVLLLLLILEFTGLNDFTNQVGSKYAVASVGIGYWICGVGSVVALVGSIKYPKTGIKAPTNIETPRGKMTKRMALAVLAVVVLLAGLAIGLTLSRSKQHVMVLNLRDLTIDGVHLVKGDVSQPSSVSQHELVTKLNSSFGSSKVFNSTICSGGTFSSPLPVAVAQWHDLAIFFVNGAFGGLVYDYKGWHSSMRVRPLRPPAGAKLTPLLKTDRGITVGDVIAPPASSFDTASGYDFLAGGGFDQFAFLRITPKVGTQNFVVTGIDVQLGQC